MISLLLLGILDIGTGTGAGTGILRNYSKSAQQPAQQHHATNPSPSPNFLISTKQGVLTHPTSMLGLRLEFELAATAPAATAPCALSGSHPELSIPCASNMRCMMSSVMTRRCSIAAAREDSLALAQCTKVRPEQWCSTIAALMLREEVAAKVMISRGREEP